MKKFQSAKKFYSKLLNYKIHKLDLGEQNLVNLAQNNFSKLQIPNSSDFQFINKFTEEHEENLSYRGILLHINYILDDLLKSKDVENNLGKLKFFQQLLTSMEGYKTKDDSPFFENLEPPVNIYPIPKEFLMSLGDQYAPRFKLFLFAIIRTLSAFSETKEYENIYIRELMFAKSFLKSLIFEKESLEKGSRFYEHIKEKDLVKLWGTAEDGIAKFIIPILNPSIQHSKIVSIPYKDTFIQLRIISNNLDSENVMLNFHGGGYIAMTSLSHEMYLRTWAKELDMTIVCVDYGLAPKHKYPYAIDEGMFIYEKLLRGEIRILSFY